MMASSKVRPNFADDVEEKVEQELEVHDYDIQLPPIGTSSN